MNEFARLGLGSSITKVLDSIGFEQPTPIQEQAIPLLLSDDKTDFIGLAQTGTGKTAAFGLPLIERIDSSAKHVQALILAPTRELGQQTAKQLGQFCASDKKLNTEVVYGGAAISVQIKALRKPTQILVATPGRLIDLIERKAVHLGKVQYVVLDEADEMLSMGFKEDIDRILGHTPEEKAIWLFSATMPSDIRRIVKKFMHSPAEVRVNTEEKVNKDIVHQYVVTAMNNKTAAVRRFLDIEPEMRGVMFCRTRRLTQQLADELGALGYGVEALHGDLSQAQRDSVMRRFKNRSMQLLIATDVAARGIDVDSLTHVIHHTLPDQLEGYTHRSGRTGRAGKRGISLAFINSREQRKIKDIERKNKIQFEKVEVPSADELRNRRLDIWMDRVVNEDLDKQTLKLAEEVQNKFKKVDPEMLIQRLIAVQLNDPVYRTKGEDLNAGLNGTSERPGREGRDGYNRYFINIGTIDHINKEDLVEFLEEVSGVSGKYISRMSLQKNCAYFDVDATQDSGFARKFKEITVSGRSIRVNRDNEGGPKNPKQHYKKKTKNNKRNNAHKRKARRR